MEHRDLNLFEFVLLCCKAIGRFFKWIVGVILKSLRLSLQYIWIVVPCVVLGIVGAWLWTKPFATTFNGNATIMYAEGMREVVHAGLVNFITLPEVSKKEYGLNDEYIDAFKGLLMYDVIDCNADTVPDYIDKNRSADLTDTLNVVMRDRVHLVLKLKGVSDFKPFEDALVKFFNTQPYLLEADRRCKKIQQEQLDYFTKEVARLDSFMTYDYFLKPRYLGAEWGNHIISEREQELYYQDMIIVLKNKNYLEMQKMSTPEIINFQTPFILYSMPIVFKYVIGLFGGVVLGLLLALAVKYKNFIMAYLKEK